MPTINIIIADDEEFIHDSIVQSLSSLDCDFEIIKNFYFLDHVEDYFFRDFQPESAPDIVILDNIFHGSTQYTGLDLLPSIRKVAPKLPILMLTTMDNDDLSFCNARSEFNIDYVKKPVSSGELWFRIESIIKILIIGIS